MTISTTTRRAGPFAGNGVQTVFPYSFKIFATSDLVVTRANSAGVETVLTLGVDYSAAMNADQDASPGGTITLLLGGLAVSSTLAITSNIPALQSVQVTNAGGFFPAVFNGVFDKLTILIQQVLEQVTRTFRAPVTSSVTDFNIPVSANAVLQWNPTGTALVAQTLPSLALSLALPSQAGHANHPFFSDGVNADWRAIAISDVTGLGSALNYLVASSGQQELRLNSVMSAIADIANLQSKANFALNAAVIL